MVVRMWCTYWLSLVVSSMSCGAAITKYGLYSGKAMKVKQHMNTLARATVQTTGRCNGYRTAMKRSMVNSTTSQTLRKLHIYDKRITKQYFRVVISVYAYSIGNKKVVGPHKVWQIIFLVRAINVPENTYRLASG